MLDTYASYKIGSSMTASFKSECSSPDTPDHLGLYLDRASAVPLLTKEDEINLYWRMQAGHDAAERLSDSREQQVFISPSEFIEVTNTMLDSEDAKQTFIAANLRLVVNLAKRFRVDRDLNLMDHIQNGNLGLNRAVEKFDGRKGYKFSTYAVNWILQSIHRGIDNSRRGRIGLTRNSESRVLHQAEKLTSEGEKLPPDIVMGLAMINQSSINSPIIDRDGENTGEQGDLIMSEDDEIEDRVVEIEFTRDLLDRLFANIGHQFRYAAEARFGLHGPENQSDEAIAATLGISPRSVRIYVSRAICIARHAAQDLPDWTTEVAS